MAVDALGPERVRCVMMPYKFTAQESLDDAAACAKALGVSYQILPIAPAVEGSGSGAGARLHWVAARRHRGESAGARARHHPDGDLQQVQCHGGDHRQQIGNVGRLRHALWRHERRLQPDQGSVQDRGVPSVAVAQRAGSQTAPWARTALLFRRTSSRARRPPNCARTRRTRIRCRLIRCSIQFWSGWSSARSRSRTSWPPVSTAIRSCGSSVCSTSPNTSAGRRRRASR